MKSTFHDIMISEITVGERLRVIDEDGVDRLAKAIKAVGLQHPITVVKETDGSHTLLAGAHRLAAVRQLGWNMIPAQVKAANWIKNNERRLHEILENLIRNELTKLDRARYLSELKDTYKALHPQARKQGGDRGNQHTGGKKSQNEIFAFCQETADKTGLSRRSIELAVAIWTGLTPDTRTRLQGTWLADNQAGLKALSEEPAERQAAICDVLFCDPPKARNLIDAIRLVDGKRKPTTADKMYSSAIGAINRMTPTKRREVYENFEDDIRAWAENRGWFI